MRAKHFLCLSRAKIWRQQNAFNPMVLLKLIQCCSTSHCLLGFCVGLCFDMHYFVSFLVLQPT